ncbi:MAG TPA: hypothetical protein VJ816_08315 [Gemmatimonadales bacterium]|nr:hypothetical protein [Gemmatimonadales bacterium]
MTDRTIRQATRTYDGRDAAERIAHLEAECAALRAELARLREADRTQRADFVADAVRELERLHV